MSAEPGQKRMEVNLSDADHEKVERDGHMHLTDQRDGRSLYVQPGGVLIDGEWWHQVVRPVQ